MSQQKTEYYDLPDVGNIVAKILLAGINIFVWGLVLFVPFMLLFAALG